MTDFPLTADLVLLNSGETARKGMYVELGLHHEIDGPICPGDRNPFMDLKQGREQGQRFRVTFHLLADNETTTAETAPEDTAEQPKGGPICKRAVLLCKRGDFQRWLLGFAPLREDREDAAKAEMYRRFGIKSRAELDHNYQARCAFEVIEQDFHDSQQGRTDSHLEAQRDRRQTG